MFDLIIRNAKLVDGTGAPARQADIAVKDGKMLKSGRLMPKPRLKLMPKVIWSPRLGRYSHPL